MTHPVPMHSPALTQSHPPLLSDRDRAIERLYSHNLALRLMIARLRPDLSHISDADLKAMAS